MNSCNPPWSATLFSPGLIIKWYVLDKIIWLPALIKSSIKVAFTVAWVPTGIKTGVSMLPLDVIIVPVRENLSLFFTLKEKFFKLNL